MPWREIFSEYDFNEMQGGGAILTLVLMTSSSFMAPTKEPPASLSLVEFMHLVEAHQRRGESKLLSESPWTRVAFMDSTRSVIRRYGTQSVMRVGLNQPVLRNLIEKMMESTESDGLTESVK